MNSEQKNVQMQNAITQGPILKNLLLFFFPIVFGTFFQMLYSTVDAVIVGQFVGKEALGAVGGSTGTLINLLVGCFTGLASGAGVVISQYYGSRDHKRVSEAIHTSFALALVSGLILTVTGVLFAPLFVGLMGAKGQILVYCISYLRIYFAGIIPSLIYNMGTGILRAVGDSKRPLYYLIFGCFLNIVLDLLFVGVFDLKVSGAAVATILSQCCAAACVLFTLMRTEDSYRLSLKKITFHKPVLAHIFRIGLPAAFQTTMYSISNVIIQAFINAFGTNVIAAWSAYSKIDQIFWMIVSALGISAATFVGQNYGAMRYDRVRQCVKISLILTFSISVFLSIAMYLLGGPLMRLFTKDSAVLAQGLELIHFLVPTFITYVCIEILASALRGMGDSFAPMLITLLGVCVLRLIWLFYSKHAFPGDVKMLVFCYPLTWIVTSVLFICYYPIASRKKGIY